MAELHKLPNGLEILLEENHTTPVISFHILVKVGSVFEDETEAGICHVIEHMLFKGTPTRPVGAIASDVEAAGGEINAYTSFDQTVFYINMASRFSAKGLDILSDAIQHPLFDATELDREKEVILEEIRRDRDSPMHRSSELLFVKAYQSHPYKNPIIGNEASVKGFTREKLLSFYTKWYVPENMTLVVVGNFQAKKMLGDITAAFKDFNGRKVKMPTISTELDGKKMSIYVEHNPFQAVYFNLGFHIPEITHDDIPAVDILSHVLAGSDSSRLERIVKEDKQLVNHISSYAFTPKYPGLFIISGVTTPAKLEKALCATWEEIKKIQTSPISTAELNRAKLNIRSGEIYEKETTGGQAGKYAYFMATAGDHLFEEKYYLNLNNVRVSNVKIAAEKYLTPANSTLIIIHPKNVDKKIDLKRIEGCIKNIKCPKADKSSEIATDPVIKTLKNGIRLILRENHALPIVAICAAVNGGIRFENKKNCGINNLIARTLVKGTKTMNSMQIVEAIESIAGSIDAFSGRNSFGVKCEFLSNKFLDGFELFSEILTQPTFAADEIAKEKLQIYDAIKHQEDSLTTVVFNAFMENLFTEHPYGLRPLGTKTSVTKITRQDMINYYAKIIDPKNMVIAISGDISPDEVVKMAEEKLCFKHRARAKHVAPKPQKAPKKCIVIEMKREEKEQAHIVMGFLGPRIGTKEQYAIAVLNNILSGQGGRLFLDLRDRQSLAYAVSSTYFLGLEPGYIGVYIGTEPSKTETAISGIKKQFSQLLQDGVNSEEIARAKHHIVGSYEMEKQRNISLAGNYSLNVLYGLGLKETEDFPNKINAVTKADIQRVIDKYIDMNAMVTTIVKP